MRFDFSGVEDVDSFISVEPGTYNCRIAEVRPGHARDGSVRWGFRLEVLDGEIAGRTAAWDSMTWSERGIYRVKSVLEAFGLDVSGEVTIEPGDLLGLRARAQVQPEEREDPVTGRRQVRMRVPYMGYAPLLPTPNGEGTGLSRVRADAKAQGTDGQVAADDSPGQLQGLVDVQGVEDE